jgi:hypothetical protein
MRLKKDWYLESQEESELITLFGEVRILNFFYGELALKGGSKEDRAEAKEWISKFMPQVVLVER